MSDGMSEMYREPYEGVGVSVKKEERKKLTEKEHLDKLVNEHWRYVEGVLMSYGIPGKEIGMCEFHYKTSAKHFWGHCREYHLGSTL